jgi:uncharacterized protein (TIGR00266 family)
MDYTISGTVYPILSISMNKGDQIVSQTYAMLSMTSGIEMKTEMYGGVTKGIRRMAGGDSIFLTFFTAIEDHQKVSFADEICGLILPLSIDKEHTYLCDRSAYLCGERSVDLDVAFMRRVRMGLFGGESFVMERLSGEGQVFLHGWGELQKTVLGAGEELTVATSRLMAVSTSVKMDVTFNKTATNILFSGQGLFLTTVTGPGEVYVQSFSAPSRLDQMNK